MINRRLMIVPPAMPSSGRTEQLDEREKKFLRLLLEMANMSESDTRDCDAWPNSLISLTAQRTQTSDHDH